MTLYSLLLRVLLIAALSLNGYAAAAMSVSGAHAMHGGRGSDRVAAPVAAVADASAAAETQASCHGHEDGAAPTPTAVPEPIAPDGAPAGDDDCCGQALCQCDCLQAAAIVRVALPLRASLAAAAPALPAETGAPNAESTRLIRPPIA